MEAITPSGNPSEGAVSVSVLRGNNLWGSKHNPLHHFVRVEFNDAVVGDSERRQDVRQPVVDYDFSCGFRCPGDGPSLDHVAGLPLIFTVIEVLPREPKQKEERTAVLAQAAVDLLPLLRGQCTISAVVPLHSAAGSPLEAVSLDSNPLLPSLEVAISVATPLLTEARRQASNLLTVTMETAFSIPPRGSSPRGDAPGAYVAALRLPLAAEKDEVLVFSEGQLRAGGEREAPDRPRKWPQAGSLAPGAQVFSGEVSRGGGHEEEEEEEYGDLTGQEARELCGEEAESAAAGGRVYWDAVRRCFLDAGGSARLSRRIEECRRWPLELTKAPPPEVPAGKVSEPETQSPFSGVAYMDLGPLLYPGATRIRGAYRVHPFSESNLLARTQQIGGLLKDQAKAAAPQLKRLSSAAGSLRAAPSKEADGGDKATKERTGEPSGATFQTYDEARTYVVMEITLEKPLVPKRPPSELALKLMELIPARPPLPPRPAGADKAVQEFHRQVTLVVDQVSAQYQQLFGAPPLDPGGQGLRGVRLLGELNYSGRYFTLKEQLKSSVVGVVREKMLRVEDLSSPEQRQAFLSQLYVYLVDQTHLALNTMTQDPAGDGGLRPVQDAQLRHFAREAELTGDFQLAARYHQERLVRGQTEPSHWSDYGSFHMRTGDLIKAEECFQHAVSLQRTHLPSLLMCGVLAETGARCGEARTFLEAATGAWPDSAVAWTLLGMFLQGQDQHFHAERCFVTAGRLSQGEGPPLEEETPPEEEEEEGRLPEENGKEEPERPVGETPRRQRPAEAGSGFLQTARFLMTHHALQMAQRALSQELVSEGRGLSVSYLLVAAQLQMLSADYSGAAASLRGALGLASTVEAWALLGHCSYLMGGARDQARRCYQRCLDHQRPPADTHLLLLRLGSVYLEEGQFQKARTTYLQACSSSPSCLTWMGLGVACYRLEDLKEAEEALTEANALNNTNPEVWGYLALVSLKNGWRVEAEQSYKYAVKLKLRDPLLLTEIRELQERLGFGDPSF